MMTREKIHRNILENLSDGVMTIGKDGMVMTFNKAAERILGLRAEDVTTRPYGEVFFGLEENDEFNQAILNAVYDSTMLHYNLVPYHREGKVLTLALTTSFLTFREESGEEKAAVIVVFDDVTEIEKLRESEKTLSDEVKKKHQELVGAYMNLEASNRDLQAALKKVQMIRWVAGAFVIVLFITIGLVSWKKAGPSPSSRPGMSSPAGKDAQVRTMVVTPQTLTDKITLKGSLKPAKIVNILSPFAGPVRETFFQYGQHVSKGQPVLRMDTTELEVKMRDAKVAYIEALENMKKYERWEQGDELAKAKRSLTKSKMSLESAKNKFENSEVLYKKGIIAKNEYDGDRQSYETSKMDYEAAEEELKTIRSRGTGDQFETVRLKLANAQHKLRELEQQLKAANVVAPVSGTIILPDVAATQDKKGKAVEKGVSFAQGDILISIGDTEGLSVSAAVDETEVIKIRPGQEARITVDAYPDINMKGRVFHVSSQASKPDTGRKTSSFEIGVITDKQDDRATEKLRLGMSATVDILILNKPDTILIPIGAVNMEGPDRVVAVQDKSAKELKKVKVETGITTLDMVEIVKGLRAGDAVVIP